ncbi:hypothetical protein [Clostridium sp. ZBS4]|uniref:hypothetical protein n=1 Tax=Clostridium sp. ZBS4 TaxID=2949974 RepID=UPI002079FA6E|nr:hypothetical protein [Clostridium sp. ZBS4]
MHYDSDNLDWNVSYSESPGTFQLYLQSLNPVVYLTKAFEISGNNERMYLKRAEEFIISWNKYRLN